MHAVTKILVVLCAGLALLLSALTMAYAANAGAIRADYQAMKQREAAAMAEAAESGAARAELERDKADLTTRLQVVTNDLRDQIRDLQTEVTEARTAAATAKLDLQGLQNANDQLNATVFVNANQLASYRDEVREVRMALLSASKREIELVDRIHDLESAREVQDQTVRSLREQLADAQYRASEGLVGETVTGETYSGPTIRARIDSVQKHPAGYDLVTISEGSNAGIRANMVLNIIRDNTTFLAKVTIVRADPQQSVGRVDYLGRSNVTAREGDLVLSRLD